MKKITSILAVSCAALMGCSTIVSGTSQPITIKTARVSGAQCTLVDSENARWTINSTPETREITKGDGPLRITCSKAGFKTAEIVVEEEFAGATLGNVILGGGIGLIVDASTGAAQEYPDEILVWLEPEIFTSELERNAWFAEKQAYEAKIAEEKKAQERNLNDEKSYN